jgi:hypothetical protein
MPTTIEWARVVAVAFVHATHDVRGATHVDEHDPTVGQVVDLVVGVDPVVAPEGADEGGVRGRGQAQHPHRLPAVQEERRPERGLARRAPQHHGVGSEHLVVVERVVDEERGDEQWPVEHLLGLGVRGVSGVGGASRVVVVDDRQRCPVRRRVDERSLRDSRRFDHELGRHRQVAEHPLTRDHTVAPRLDDVGEAPHRDPSPGDLVAEVRRREERPVPEEVAGRSVRDVVRGQAERPDPESHLPLTQLGRFGRHGTDVAVIAPVDEHVPVRHGPAP